jgi:DNA repair photolyase
MLQELNSSEIPWYDKIPISINDTYGDPFIVEQIENTCEKLKSLMDHQAPIAIFTKAPYDRNVLDALRPVCHNPKAIVYYSLTGLDEGGYSFENRVEMIQELNHLFDRVVILTRPIIHKRNDTPGNLQRIVEVAAEHTSGYLVLGGVHDKYKNKKIDFSVEEMLIEMCDKAGVKSFHKTSCCAAYLFNESCWMHDLGEPINLEVAREIGYDFHIEENKIILPSATTGDLNFLRMLTRAEIYAEEIVSNYNLLTLKTGSQKLESTSSWFAWAKNLNVCIDCDYCIIKQIEYLKTHQVEIGVHPRELLNIIKKENAKTDLTELRYTKIRSNAKDLHQYKDVRITKPCLIKRYLPIEQPIVMTGV